jgi:hypothetical protein
MINYIKSIVKTLSKASHLVRSSLRLDQSSTQSIPIEPQTSENQTIGEIQPKIPYQFIEFIEELTLTVPDFSQTVKRTQQLGNTGHYVEFSGLSKSKEEEANKAIELMASSVYTAGIDGLVNTLFRQILVTGSISIEFVPDIKLEKIEKVVIVPTKTIRFYYDGENYLPYQETTEGKTFLNTYQYSYIPLLQYEDSPYSIPPFLSALNLARMQKNSIGDLQNIIKKYGLLGFVFAKRKIPYNSNMGEEEYKSYLQKELIKFAENFRANFSSGAAVSYDDVDIQHHSITDNTNGAEKIFQMIEQQIASGLDIDPSLLGRTYSTTETYAGVVYHAFLSNLNNIRRLIKRVLEKIYYTHLILQGFQLDRVTVTFNPDKSLNPKADAEVEKINVETVILKLNAGIIDYDTAARELGYEKATGLPEKKP